MILLGDVLRADIHMPAAGNGDCLQEGIVAVSNMILCFDTQINIRTLVVDAVGKGNPRQRPHHHVANANN